MNDKSCRWLGTNKLSEGVLSPGPTEGTAHKILEDPGLTACARDSHATYKVQWQPERFKEPWCCAVARYSYLTILTLIITVAHPTRNRKLLTHFVIT